MSLEESHPLKPKKQNKRQIDEEEGAEKELFKFSIQKVIHITVLIKMEYISYYKVGNYRMTAYCYAVTYL